MHLYLDVKPLDYNLSDTIELKVVHFNNESRDGVFERYDISEETARRDSLQRRAEDLTEIADAYLKRTPR